MPVKNEEAERIQEYWWTEEDFQRIPETERAAVYRLLKSIEMTKEISEAFRLKLANLILMQFNEDTRKAELDYENYRAISRRSLVALLMQVYVDEFTHDLAPRDIIFNSIMNYISAYLTRIYLGRDKQYDIQMQQAANPSPLGVMK